MMSYNNSKTMLARWSGNDDNDSARPSSVWRGARPTKPAVIGQTGAATAGRSPVSGAPPAESTRPGRVQTPFFGRSPRANRRQPSLSHHGQSDMAMPTVPVTDLVLVQARLAFGRFETLFDGRPCRRDLGQSFQARLQRS